MAQNRCDECGRKLAFHRDCSRNQERPIRPVDVCWDPELQEAVVFYKGKFVLMEAFHFNDDGQIVSVREGYEV
jgi:hypothetical protein